jgi:NitT/TauT family transport system ATP-binding protein
MTLLQVQDASIVYDTAHRITVAVHRISFEAARGERLMVLGRSGCGKSTLLKAIGGYLEPSEGTIALEGKPITRPGPDRMIVWQDTDQLLPWKTVRQNVMYPMLLNGVQRAEATERADAFIAKVDLTRAADEYPHQLSGGMKMRVAVARGFAMRPSILLMDEPFGALDALTRGRLQDELLNLLDDSGATLLFVTHDIGEAVKLGSRILVLSPFPGQLIADLKASDYSDKSDLTAKIAGMIRAERAA